MFELFDGRARQVVVLAQEESRRLHHSHIGTEHLLLGALRDPEAVSARALGSLGISLDATRQQVEVVVGKETNPSPSHLQFTARGKKALELALREALALRHDHIGDGHILLGIIREGEGTGLRVLGNLGVEPEDLRAQVRQLLGSARYEAAPDDIAPDVSASSGIEIAVEVEPGHVDGPRCGRCNTPAVDNVRARTIPVPQASGQTPDSVTLIWCGTCGAVFGVTPGSKA